MRVKFGSIIVDGRGKLGGHVVSKGRSGHFMRTNSSKASNRTKYQQEQRQLIGNLLNLWDALQQSSKDKWDLQADLYGTRNAFGDLVLPTGKNLFIELNSGLLLAGSLPHFDPPLKQPTREIYDFYWQSTLNTQIEIYLRSYNENDIIIYGTPPLKPTINNLNKHYRVIFAGFTGGWGAMDLTSALNQRFGVYKQGQKVGIKVIPMRFDTGIKGQPLQIQTILT